MYVYGMGNKMGTGAPRALRLRLAMHLFVKYKPKSFFTFGMEVSHLCLHRSLCLCSTLIEGYRHAGRVFFFSSSKIFSSEFVHDIEWVLMSVHALHDSRTEAPSQLSIRFDSTHLANDSVEPHKHLDNIHSVERAYASRPEANSPQL
jgi:hypothetical protein